MSKLNIFDKRQLEIARKTLKMSDVGARIMGGMTKEEARAIILKLTGTVQARDRETVEIIRGGYTDKA